MGWRSLGDSNPCFRRERARFGALEVFRRSEPLRRGADRGFVLSHWPSSPDRTCDAPAGVVERRHAVAIGARRAGDAACAIVKGPYPVSVGAGASGDAAVGVVENARVLSLGGRERRKRGQECDGDDSHDRSLQPHRSLPPIFFRLALHRRRRRILELEPVPRAAADIRRAEACLTSRRPGLPLPTSLPMRTRRALGGLDL